MKTDQELLSYYETTLESLQKIREMVQQHPSYADVEVSVFGIPCRMSVRHLQDQLLVQMMYFEGLIGQMKVRMEHV